MLLNTEITMCYSAHSIFTSLAWAFVEAIFFTLAHKINANKLLFKSREDPDKSSGATVQVTGNDASVQEESGYCCF